LNSFHIPRYALFDLKIDPAEKSNLYEQERELAAELHQTLEEVLEESRTINRELRKKGGPPKQKSAAEQKEIMRSMKALGYLQ
jgi:hypothetical protein